MLIKTFKRELHRLGWHKWSYSEWIERYRALCVEARRIGEDALQLIRSRLYGLITDGELRTLLTAWEHVIEHGGYAPGPDGMTPDEPTPSQRCDILRRVWCDIIEGEYKHDPTKPVPIPKRDGGKRIIHVPNVVDRVVQRAIVEILQPLIDPQFYAWSFGFRPHRSRLHALAVIEALVARGHRVLVNEDLADAFGSVPVGPCLQTLASYTGGDRDITRLVRNAVAMGGPAGIMMGGPLSPLLLNVHLTRVLDEPWVKSNPEVPLVRYADNIIIACRSPIEALAARFDLNEMVRDAGYRLKEPKDGRSTIYRLDRGEVAHCLGFDISLRCGQLHYAIPDDAFARLYEQVWEAEKNPRKAKGGGKITKAKASEEAVIRWLKAMGPAYADSRRDDVFDAIFRITDRLGVNVRGEIGLLKKIWRSAYRDWSRLRKQVIAETRESKGTLAA